MNSCSIVLKSHLPSISYTICEFGYFLYLPPDSRPFCQQLIEYASLLLTAVNGHLKVYQLWACKSVPPDGVGGGIKDTKKGIDGVGGDEAYQPEGRADWREGFEDTLFGWGDGIADALPGAKASRAGGWGHAERRL
jgi:hypothetical protein